MKNKGQLSITPLSVLRSFFRSLSCHFFLAVFYLSLFLQRVYFSIDLGPLFFNLCLTWAGPLFPLTTFLSAALGNILFFSGPGAIRVSEG